MLQNSVTNQVSFLKIEYYDASFIFHQSTSTMEKLLEIVGEYFASVCERSSEMEISR